MTVVICLFVNYYIVWDMPDSRNAIGEFFVIGIVDLLLPGVYYFYATLIQSIIEQLKVENRQVYQRTPCNESE